MMKIIKLFGESAELKAVYSSGRVKLVFKKEHLGELEPKLELEVLTENKEYSRKW